MERLQALNPSISFEVEPMDQSLEIIFSTMMRQGDFPEAIEFLRSVDMQYIPSKNVLIPIVFDILMKCKDARTLSKSAAYLSNILKIFPPTTEERQTFYYDFIRGTHGTLVDLWAVVGRIVNSYLCHHEIYILENDKKGLDDIKYPNCKFLLEFYIELFTVDFEHCLKSGATSHISNLLWPSGDMSSSNRVESLLRWINDIYQYPYINQKGDLLKPLHELVTLMIKCIIYKNDLSEITAFSSSPLIRMTEDLTNFCPNACQEKNLKLFLTFLPLKSLRARVSEKLIKLVLKQIPKYHPALTLKNIVSLYMYPQKSIKGKKAPLKLKLLRKRSLDKKHGDTLPSSNNSSAHNKKSTKLHELCKKDKFADLLLAMRTSFESLNARDQSGATPLHEACRANSYMCVQMLINESGKGQIPKLDYTVPDCDGVTPLHIAVKLNFVDIARLLLENGGSSLLDAIDNNGKNPRALCKGEEMKKILEKFKTNSNEPDYFIDQHQHQDAPMFKSYKEYNIYLHALNCLLCSYCDVFQLFNLKSTAAQDHNQKTCYHFTESDTCSEDVMFLREIPGIIETFVQSLLKNASKNNLPIGIEIIPLKAFAASIKTFR